MNSSKDFSIVEYQENFCLQQTSHQGGVIWKCDPQLTCAIIVGEDSTGQKYVVKNQPQHQNYRLVPIDSFITSYCYFDTQNVVYDYQSIALYAFQMLYNYNDFNQKTYDADYKVILPHRQTYFVKEPVTFASFQKQLMATAGPLKDVVVNVWDSIQRIYEHLQQLLFPNRQVALPEAKELHDTPRLGSPKPDYKIIDINKRKQKIA